MKQQPQKAAPTAAQSAIIHVAQSAGLSSLVSLLIGVTQYLATGNIDVHTLLSVLGGGFLTSLTMIWKSISTNPNLAQAASDTLQEVTPPWLNQDIQRIAQKPAPKPIVMPTPAVLPPAQPAQQQSGGGGMPADYYSRYQRPSIPDMATQGYVPAIRPDQSMLGSINLNASATSQPYTGVVPPAQQNQFNPQQGG